LANTGVKTLPTGLTATNINEKFPMRMAQLDNISYYSEGESLPMYGEISNWGSTYDCEMIRAVAKIQVKLGETFTDLTGGSPSWPNDIYYQFNFLPPGGDIQPANTVAYHTLSLGYSTPPNVDFRLLQDDAHPSDPKAVYVYEFRSSTQVVWNASSVLDTDFDPGRPHLMLVDAANQAFWRLDFYDSHPSRKRFIDIKRNCHYIFTINRVSSPGYTNPGNATQNPGSNIEYTVKVDGAYDHITSNGQYAIATSVDSAFVRADTANAAIAKVRYILGTGMSSLGTAVDTVMTTTGSGLTVNSPIKLKPTPSSADVVVTTTGSFQEDSIIFRLGNIVHKLYVKAK
ncbi:MAG: hypothetical protein LBE91_02550, partial [Tannerella sp.]|nr:hypothetical protein [Tannerella sp.]